MPAKVSVDQVLGAIQIARVLISLGMVVKDGIVAIFGHGALTDEQINAIESAAEADDDRRIARRIAEMPNTP